MLASGAGLADELAGGWFGGAGLLPKWFLWAERQGYGKGGAKSAGKTQDRLLKEGRGVS